MSKQGIFKIIPIFLFFVFSFPVTVSAASDGGAESMRQQVLAIDAARKNALEKNSAVTGNEESRREYQMYINYLDTRMAELCAALRTGYGIDSVNGLPCPAGSMLSPGDGVPPALTSSEQVTELDRRLIRSLGEFDEMLGEEQQKLASRQGSSSGGGQVYGDAGRGSGHQNGAHGGQQTGGRQGRHAGQDPADASYPTVNKNGSNGTLPGKADSETGGGRSPGAVKASTDAKGVSGVGSGEKSAEVSGAAPDTYDDDIVARQLREAAEQETDPELKKKLWEEYRRYKEGKKR